MSPRLLLLGGSRWRIVQLFHQLLSMFEVVRGDPIHPAPEVPSVRQSRDVERLPVLFSSLHVWRFITH
jgi:hypothetical protein